MALHTTEKKSVSTYSALNRPTMGSATRAAAPPATSRRAAPSSDGMRTTATLAAIPSMGISVHTLRFHLRLDGLEAGKDFSIRRVYNDNQAVRRE